MTVDENEIVSCLSDEYKILQDKIDKIGAFRFTIKGWSITVIIGALFAGSATNAIPPVLWLVTLLVFLLVFFLFEKKQTDLSHNFGERVLTIEAAMSRRLRKSARESGSNDFIELRFVPGIAHHLKRQQPEIRRPRSRWRGCRDADVHFYIFQGLLVISVVLWHGGSATQTDRKVGVTSSGPTQGVPADTVKDKPSATHDHAASNDTAARSDSNVVAPESANNTNGHKKTKNQENKKRQSD